MTAATQASLNFRAIAQEALPSTQKESDMTRELVPAEGAARQQREGNQFMSRPTALGATVDQEGLTNAYAVMPKAYFADFPSPEQIRNYLVQGAVAALFVSSLIVTAFIVS